jgi:NAD(P)-dependent dehydrogenase (short-subunit alcohol dehydrogenase family)
VLQGRQIIHQSRAEAQERKLITGQVAIITGAGSGIGRGVAQLFHQQGAHIGLIDINAKSLDETVGMLGDGSRKALAVKADLGVEESVAEAFRAIIRRFGHVDALINVAGATHYKDFLEFTGAEWDRQQAVNLKSIYLCCKEALPVMKAGGSIVNTASVHALASGPRIAPYAAAKGGMLALTRALACEFGPRGIRVNAICPGCIDTPMMDRTLHDNPDPQGFAKAMNDRIPLGRFGTPLDIARVALFLASPLSEYLSGCSIPVDGGLMAGLPMPN